MLGFYSKEKRNTVNVTVSSRTVIRVLTLAMLWVVLFAAIRQAAHAVVLIFTAFFLALALNAPVQWLSIHLPGKRRGNRTLATAVSFIIVIALLGTFIGSLVPPIVRQTSSFIDAAPHLIEEVRSQDSAVGKFVRRYKLQNQVDKVSKQLSSRLDNVAGTAAGTVTKVGASIFSVLTILALTFMMLAEGPRWLKFFEEIVPDTHRAHVNKLATDMYRVVKGYVNGQVTLAFIAATLLLPAMLMLHISYPIALMFVVFICGLIPMVGHTIGAAIVTLVALFHSPISAVIILAYYIFYQQVENYGIQPRIQANSTNMSPLLVFASVVIGVNFGGLFGGLVAIPLAGCIRIAILDYLQNSHILTRQEVNEVVREGEP